jgi:hypothetical protein
MQDKGTQRALLALVLDRRRVWTDELRQEFGSDAEPAIEALVSAGLVRRIDELVVPTPAALHFDRLELP